MSKKNSLKKKEVKELKSAAVTGPAASPAGVFRFSPWLLLPALLAWFAIVYKNYLPVHPDISNLFAGSLADFSFTGALSGFFAVLPANALNFLLLALFVLLAYGMGLGLLSVLGVVLPAIESFIFAVGLGLGAAAYLMFLLGAAGALYKSVIFTLFFLGAAVSAYKARIWEFRAGALKNELGEILKLGPVWVALVLLGGLFVLLNVVMALAPEMFYDSLVYHLAAPSYYLLKHRILPMRFLCHSNFPLNQSMIYMLALSLGNEMLAKMLHCLMGSLTALLLYFSVKRTYNAKAGVLSALIFCSIPLFAMNSWTCGNDVGLTFFFALSYAAYLGWLGSGGTGQFLLFSVYSGIAMGTKYTAAFSLAGIAASLAFASWRAAGAVQAAKKLSLYLGTVLLFILPWFIKNYIFTRNPFQPFFYASLGGENLKLAAGATGGALGALGRLFGPKILTFLASPWNLSLAGDNSLTYLGPVFLLLSPCLLLFKKMDRLIKYSLAAFCAGYAAWYMSGLEFRYILPLFTVLSVCLGWAVSLISERFKAFKLLVAAMLAVNLLSVFAAALKLGLNDYFAKRASKEEYLSVTRLTSSHPPYAAIDWMNNNLPPDAKVFFIGESRPFYLKRDFLSYSAEINVQPLMAYLRKANSPDDLYAALSGEKFTHLLINYREALERNPAYRNFDWTKREMDLFDGFWKKHVKLEYFKEGVYVYSLLPDAGPNGTPDILVELENNNWASDSLLKIFDMKRMWASCLEEYERYAGYGNDVSRQINLIKSFLADPAKAPGANK